MDRDGKHFRHILNWLRDSVVPTLKDTEYSELLWEAEYYQLLVSHPFIFLVDVLFFRLMALEFFQIHSAKCKTVILGTDRRN